MAVFTDGVVTEGKTGVVRIDGRESLSAKMRRCPDSVWATAHHYYNVGNNVQCRNIASLRAIRTAMRSRPLSVITDGDDSLSDKYNESRR